MRLLAVERNVLLKGDDKYSLICIFEIWVVSNFAVDDFKFLSVEFNIIYNIKRCKKV